jgi:hypothetical protein
MTRIISLNRHMRYLFFIPFIAYAAIQEEGGRVQTSNPYLMNQGRFEKEILGGIPLGDDFAKVTLPNREDQRWLIFISAPWCEHCKRL